MTPFVLYQRADGRILSSGTSFEPETLAGAGQAVLVVERACDPSCHYVRDGQVLPMPPNPGDGYRFNYALKQWEPHLERLWFLVRRRRDELLAGTDWRLLRAAETGTPVEQEWLDYRQALRDITEQPDPAWIEWPEVPGLRQSISETAISGTGL
ncbi:MAG: tail fiber assembly protein [Comamonas sp.]